MFCAYIFLILILDLTLDLLQKVQAESRGDLRPDPRLDAVNIVTIVIQEDNNFDTQVYVLLHYCGKEASWRYLF